MLLIKSFFLYALAIIGSVKMIESLTFILIVVSSFLKMDEKNQMVISHNFQALEVRFEGFLLKIMNYSLDL